ncbi:pyruvate dehydrogenase (acetyl-transferring) E1 component subunit alpha [Rhodococcus sp. PAMC28707]|uniref:pyruvate dehydrogenase (acetyl-transferring) E1 component subunit alpha n=1 Tax=unclassified Rhodococcus (in: high G+C Gram-positive bacteria) TaxID=192944 RepID=UPI00109DFECA|nr:MULTISPECIES: pyruvate dehydrogenase (acetyl-transferring) E1 component subunit alpha [unclassified Rhodococcus (in: high G+C Gram-positive bacteria)]QCB49732.1 pyruvate dehydrogenase (acetyl-transferring) E1 component subunit alpha [Rhodococcus sp. PAMC28705]QCB58576.1 pyruvate dehydrogenase (acetyl-transferring) E1 component subunit alpha [Rhodococcus sp. PAMC28707]
MNANSSADTLIQIVTPEGKRTPQSEYSDAIADVTIDTVRELYEDLVVVRRIDAEATALQRQGELGLWAPLLGQEAAQVGSARALHSEDFVFASYREHGVAYCRGVDPTEMLRFWRGSTQSGWNPYDYNMTTPAIIVGSQGLHATGYGLGMKFDGAEGAVITYFGDGATSQGDISEALGFAASFSAPVVFFCQNNQWAISAPVSVQTHITIAERGRGFGVPALRVDGNDVLAVLAATRIALARAREGSGPTLIEALTYRMGPHTTSDDPTRYRSAAVDDEWKRKDPIERIRLLLERAGGVDEEFETRVRDRADTTAAQLRAGCLGTIEPSPMSLFDHVYAEPHSLISEEREHYSSYLAGFEGARS